MRMANGDTVRMRVVMVGPGLGVKGGISTVEKLILRHAPEEVCLRHISTSEDGSVFKKVGVFVLGGMRLMWALLSFRPHLVHIHFSKRGSTVRKGLLLLLARAFRTPVLLHAHSGDFAPFFHALPGFAQRLIAWVLRRSSGLIALSQTGFAYYATELGMPAPAMRVLANPIEFPPAAVKPPQADGPVVVYLGRISQAKGAFDLLQAYGLLNPELRQGARLIMAGDGETQLAREQAKTLSAVSEVTVLDWLDPVERDELLRRAHIFVLPSYYEGLPMSLLEAMANGVAVVVTPVGGMPEVVQDGINGLLVPAGDVEGLAAALQRLLQDPTYCQALGLRARQSVAHLDVHAYLPKLLEAYQTIIFPVASS